MAGSQGHYIQGSGAEENKNTTKVGFTLPVFFLPIVIDFFHVPLIAFYFIVFHIMPESTHYFSQIAVRIHNVCYGKG